MDVDFYAGNCHKWLMTPKGSAFLYVRPELQRLINPLVISHGWTADSKLPGAKGAFGNSPFIDELEMQGTRDPAAWLTVPAALAFRARARLGRRRRALPDAGAGHRAPAGRAHRPRAAERARNSARRRWSRCRFPTSAIRSNSSAS